jgi:cytoplasmic iron level regulating protein YaaA (DUF328/UPF0246 family)
MSQLIFLSSPAKSYNFDNRFKEGLKIDFFQPEFISQTTILWQNLKNQKLDKLAKTLEISSNLAKLNQERFLNWQKEHTLSNSYLAISAFFGDVFKQLEISKYSQKEIDYISKTFFIISGFYGLLNAFSLIQPYRLEMKLSLDVDGKKIKLADFWQPILRQYFNQKLAKKTIINLASQEYSNALDYKNIKNKILDINFKQKNKQGEYKSIGILTKKARGKFLNWAFLNQIETINQLKGFNLDNYSLQEETEKTLTFYQNV